MPRRGNLWVEACVRHVLLADPEMPAAEVHRILERHIEKVVDEFEQHHPGEDLPPDVAEVYQRWALGGFTVRGIQKIVRRWRPWARAMRARRQAATARRRACASAGPALVRLSQRRVDMKVDIAYAMVLARQAARQLAILARLPEECGNA